MFCLLCKVHNYLLVTFFCFGIGTITEIYNLGVMNHDDVRNTPSTMLQVLSSSPVYIVHLCLSICCSFLDCEAPAISLHEI